MIRLMIIGVLALAALPAWADDAAESPTKERVLVKPIPRLGHYIALGFHGIGGLVDDEDREIRGPAAGWGFSIRLGERMVDWLDVGIRFSYSRMGGDDPWTFGHLMVTSQLYLQERLFLHGGFGAGGAQGKDPDDAGLNRGSYSAAFSAGVGYNLYLSPADENGGFIATPLATIEYHPDSEFSNAAIMFGVEFSYWNGVSRNQLDVGVDKAYRRR